MISTSPCLDCREIRNSGRYLEEGIWCPACKDRIEKKAEALGWTKRRRKRFVRRFLKGLR